MPFLPLQLLYARKYIETQVQVSQKLKKSRKVTLIKVTVHHLVGDFVLFPNIKLHNIKGGRFSYAWLGPHILTIMSPRGVAALTNQDSCALKTK